MAASRELVAYARRVAAVPDGLTYEQAVLAARLVDSILGTSIESPLATAARRPHEGRTESARNRSQ